MTYDEKLNALMTWANIQSAVIKQGEYSPLDMHPLPKGKLIELFDTFAHVVSSQNVPNNNASVNDNPKEKKASQREMIQQIMASQSKPLTLIEITRLLGSRSVANVQKTLNAMISDNIIKKDDGFFALS